MQEIFHEHSTHLLFLNEHLALDVLESSTVPEKLRIHITQNYKPSTRHHPYFIYGADGTGKSSLISRLYSQVTGWFEHAKVHRVIRFAAATPRSAYNLELLRVICQQMSIFLNIPEGYLPKDASFDPVYINSWFQRIITRCEEMHNNEIIFIFIDDLHKLNPLECDIVAALSWIPVSLPWNVYLICSTAVPIDALKLTQMQKERFKHTDYLCDLAHEACKTVVKRDKDDEPFTDFIDRQFDLLENEFGKIGFSRLATYITCTEYGLTETEFLELLMPTQNIEASIETRQGDFNFSSFRAIRNKMSK